jgi:glycolate oxidase FAD binding subunit
MGETFKALCPEQILDVVQWAVAKEQAVDVRGLATKRDYGCPPSSDVNVLDISGVSGIDLYEPGELVMSAAAATPMSEILAALDEHKQWLSFEPPNLGPLLGSGVCAGSIGGVIACNLAGSRRVASGSARDHILGFHAISGRGEKFKSGGRVVKNVTGFDLSKLMAGSFGTLGVMSDVTFRVLPRPEKSRTVLVMTKDSACGIKALTSALQSSCEVSAAAHLPFDITTESVVPYVAGAQSALSAIRVEGPGPSVEYRTNILRQLLSEFGDTEELDTSNTITFWREVCDVNYFVLGREQIWRLSVPPADGAKVAQKILDSIGGRVFFDWGGGLIWLAIEERPDGAHRQVRNALKKSGGHATLLRAAAEVRSRVPVFQPQADAQVRISARVKNSFDPKGLLCPGRMI